LKKNAAELIGSVPVVLLSVNAEIKHVYLSIENTILARLKWLRRCKAECSGADGLTGKGNHTICARNKLACVTEWASAVDQE
jgi:hypothetical protein